MTYTIKIPSDEKYPCCEGSCPFFNFGDSGYAEHCNLLDGFMSPNTKILYDRYEELREATYGYVNKRFKRIHGLRKGGKKSWDLYAKREKKVRKLQKKINRKMFDARKIWQRCPFYGKDFELKIPERTI